MAEEKIKQEEKKELVQKTEKKPENIADKQTLSNKVATVICKDLPISVKYSRDICKFIKGKSPKEAITLLERVMIQKIAVPMTGEYAHRRGIGIAGGKYPVKSSEYFIKALKNLIANASNKGMNTEKLVVFARASKGAGVTHSGWRRRQFKRAHLYFEAKEK